MSEIETSIHPGPNETESSSGLWKRFLHGRAPGSTWIRIIGVAVGAVILFEGILIPIKVVGFSMFPTYKPGEINYINRFAFAKRDPQRGEVVSIGTTGRQVTILKRVIGLPGDIVSMRKGVVSINGAPITESYIETKNGFSTRTPVQLATDEYWVIGDNRMISEFSKIHRRHILGKPLF